MGKGLATRLEHSSYVLANVISEGPGEAGYFHSSSEPSLLASVIGNTKFHVLAQLKCKSYWGHKQTQCGLFSNWKSVVLDKSLQEGLANYHDQISVFDYRLSEDVLWFS